MIHAWSMFDLRREINRPNQLKFINSDTQINSELSTELTQAEKRQIGRRCEKITRRKPFKSVLRLEFQKAQSFKHARRAFYANFRKSQIPKHPLGLKGFFPSYILSQNIKKTDLISKKTDFYEKDLQCRKTERGDPLVSPGIVITP